MDEFSIRIIEQVKNIVKKVTLENLESSVNQVRFLANMMPTEETKRFANRHVEALFANLRPQKRL